MSDPVGPGRELDARALDALVAERVMGWRPLPAPSGDAVFCARYWQEYGTEYRLTPDNYVIPGFPAPVPHYSTRVSDAWDVVARMRDAGWRVNVTDNPESTSVWQVTFDNVAYTAFGTADTAAEAICLAALLCVGAACGGETEGA